MKRKCDGARRGFTLIELLVVVLILGILMSIALPSFLSSVEKSKMATANAHARQIALAVQSDYVRSGGDTYVPYGSSPLRNDPDVMGDLGGKIPDNPCSASPGLGGYNIEAYVASWKIWPKWDLCPSRTGVQVFYLGNR